MRVANDRSLAWGIARVLASHGADLAFTYPGAALGKRVVPLADSVGSNFVMPCDVTDAASLEDVFATVKDKWGGLDFVVHAIAYSDRTQLKGRYVDTTTENFAMTLDVSCYSFTAVCRHAEPLMTSGGSLLTLTYYGAERVVPHYNVMGVATAALEASVRYLAVDRRAKDIRVNALSAWIVKPLAASGTGDFRYFLTSTANHPPLRPAAHIR